MTGMPKPLREQGRPSRPSARRRALQRRPGDLHRARCRQARSRGGRRGDPRGVEDAAVAPGRLPDAGRARRRALRGQGADAQKPGDQLHPGRAAAQAAAADGGADALDDHRHHPHRGRGAAARGAADQALPAALQRAAAGRQKLPVHPAARGPCLPAHPEAPRRAAHQRRILRPVRERRIGHPHA